MSKDIGILISAQDNFSQAVNKMAQANASFNKDLEGLQKKLDSLNKTKVAMKIDADKIKKELKDLKKAFEETADEKIGKRIEERSFKFENIKRDYRKKLEKKKDIHVEDILSYII